MNMRLNAGPADPAMTGARSPPSPKACSENLVAAHLLKWVHFQQDARGRDVELRYFRDTDRREVDFVVVGEAGPDPPRRMQVGDADVDRSLRYRKERSAKAEAWQVSAGRKDYRTPEGIRVAPAGVLLRTLA